MSANAEIEESIIEEVSVHSQRWRERKQQTDREEMVIVVLGSASDNRARERGRDRGVQRRERQRRTEKREKRKREHTLL
jgi:hypothetical protein